ncbi:MAG TPA: DnaB-like helicase C-terminal domain-containing protein, partial [Candidatus Bipolaricaulis anaerobius]|nr:DnaB-like helicase C-terminal domain-containing protein [Candidatus Bipolaricaulis anaerobius]
MAEELLPEDFSHPREQRFWKVARELDRSGNLTLDALTERLTKGEPEGGKPEEGIVAYLSTLAAEEAVPPTLLPRYVAQIKNAARKREIRDYHREALKRLEAGELDADAHIRESKAKLEKWEATPSSDAKPVSTRLKGIYESILSEGTKPVPTFSAQLNANLNGGLQRGEVITIASPAGAGKTTFALQLAVETIREQSRRVDGPPCAVVYVTIEMSEKELITKSLSRLGRVDSGHIRDKSIGEAKLKPAMDTYEKELSPVVYFIEAHEGMTLGEVRSTTRKVKTRLADAVKGTTENPDALEPFVILCVDPFQRLLTDNAAVDSEEISRVGALASGLKQLARDL